MPPTYLITQALKAWTPLLSAKSSIQWHAISASTWALSTPASFFQVLMKTWKRRFLCLCDLSIQALSVEKIIWKMLQPLWKHTTMPRKSRIQTSLLCSTMRKWEALILQQATWLLRSLRLPMETNWWTKYACSLSNSLWLCFIMARARNRK